MMMLLKVNTPQSFLSATKRTKMRGTAIVEFAIFLLPMLLLALGVAEYGRAMYQYNTLTKSVRDSARLLSQFNPADAGYPVADAKCLAVYGNTSCTGSPLASGLTTAMVQVCDQENSAACPGNTYANVATGHGTINLVEVKITGYQFDFALNPLSLFGDTATTIPFGNIHATMRQIL